MELYFSPKIFFTFALSKTKNTMAQYVNPIYDTVFKYIMQDEKVAKILIGNILNTKVESITMNNNEYSAVMPNGQTVFKLDFSARIVDDNGNKQLVHIEVQKALEQGEIMRFRQYMGALYMDNTKCTKETVKSKNNKNITVEHPLPIHSIYILGHELGDGLDYSVMHGDNIFRDQNGNIISVPANNDYINGLTHKITFVIAPLTKKNVKTHLDKLLSIFSECDPYNPQRMIEIDEFFDDSDDYRTIMKALQKASVDAQLRGNLDLEQYAYKKYLNLENEINDLQEQLAEKDRKTAQKLFAIGQSVEEIAEFLSVDVEKIKEYLP